MAAFNTTDTAPVVNHSVKSGKNRSVHTENRSVQSTNTTVLTTTTTSEWDAAPMAEAANTGKKIEIRYNKRKNKEPYYYWVWRWPAEENGKPVKRPSGTYVRKYTYGGKLETVNKERLERYEARK